MSLSLVANQQANYLLVFVVTGIHKHIFGILCYSIDTKCPECTNIIPLALCHVVVSYPPEVIVKCSFCMNQIFTTTWYKTLCNGLLCGYHINIDININHIWYNLNVVSYWYTVRTVIYCSVYYTALYVVLYMKHLNFTSLNICQRVKWNVKYVVKLCFKL